MGENNDHMINSHKRKYDEFLFNDDVYGNDPKTSKKIESELLLNVIGEELEEIREFVTENTNKPKKAENISRKILEESSYNSVIEIETANTWNEHFESYRWHKGYIYFINLDRHNIRFERWTPENFAKEISYRRYIDTKEGKTRDKLYMWLVVSFFIVVIVAIIKMMIS